MQKKTIFSKVIEAGNLIKHVLRKRNYFIVFASISILMFAVFYMLTLATTTDYSLSIFIRMNGFWFMISAFFLLGVAALLFGIYITLFAYKIRFSYKGGKMTNIFGAGGLVSGLFGAGCPMCGGFLFGLVGAPLALFFMPFKGLELRVLAIILLGVSNYFIAKSLIECRIRRKDEVLK